MYLLGNSDNYFHNKMNLRLVFFSTCL
jgi:hypothetical protein